MLRGSSTRAARAAAIVTWIYAAGFGGCIVPVSVYLLKHGSLPSFFGLFDMYAGPWWSRFDDGTFAVLLISHPLSLRPRRTRAGSCGEAPARRRDEPRTTAARAATPCGRREPAARP